MERGNTDREEAEGEGGKAERKFTLGKAVSVTIIILICYKMQN